LKKSQQQFLIVALLVLLVLSLTGIIGVSIRMAGVQVGEFRWPWEKKEEPTPTPSQFSASVPIEFVVKDQWQGGAVDSATIDFYIHGSNVKEETLTTSSGKATSSFSYKSGTLLDVYVALGDTKYWFIGVQVPYYDTAEKAAAVTKHQIALDFWTLGSYAISVVGPDGNAISDNGNLNKTVLGNTPTLTVTIRNTVDNTGFKSCSDPIEGYMDQAIVLLKLTGTGSESVILKAPSWPYKEIGNDRYWGSAIPDADLTRIKAADGTVTQEGVHTFSVSLDLTNYSGDLADLVITVYAYSSWDYFNYYGAAGADAVQLAQMTINLVD